MQDVFWGTQEASTARPLSSKRCSISGDKSGHTDAKATTIPSSGVASSRVDKSQSIFRSDLWDTRHFQDYPHELKHRSHLGYGILPDICRRFWTAFGETFVQEPLNPHIIRLERRIIRHWRDLLFPYASRGLTLAHTAVYPTPLE